jgi:hypothetical protein
VVRNNVFIAARDARLTFPKCADYRFERNVLHAPGTITFTNPQAITAFADNVLFSGTGQVVGQKLRDYRKAGAEALKPGEGSILADPKLIELERGIVRFAPDSPARRLGVEPIDVSAAGPRR